MSSDEGYGVQASSIDIAMPGRVQGAPCMAVVHLAAVNGRLVTSRAISALRESPISNRTSESSIFLVLHRLFWGFSDWVAVSKQTLRDVR